MLTRRFFGSSSSSLCLMNTSSSSSPALMTMKAAFVFPASTTSITTAFQNTSYRMNSSSSPSSSNNKVKVTFVDGKKNIRKECEAQIGKTLLNIGLENQFDIEAACDGTCACSTCHVYIDEEHFEKMDKATEDEEDMLDLALDRRPTSRLCCQLTVSKECDGMELELPDEVSSQM